MKIAIDARMVRHTGIGRYLAGLLEDLPSRDPAIRYHYLLPTAEVANYDVARPRVRAVACDAPLYSLREQAEVFVKTATADADLLYCPHYVIPWLWRRRLVATVHDLIHLLFPTSAIQRYYSGLMLQALAHQDDRVVVVSRWTAGDLLRHGSIAAARVEVVYPGVDLQAYRPDGPDPGPVLKRYGLRPPYFFSVGQWKASKNLPRLVRAFAASGLPERGFRLAIAGRPDPRCQDLPALAAALPCADRVHFPGFIAEEDLPALYRGAYALVFPSLYEGFGLPPLEAMACGTPVISSRAASLPEVVGDAALLCDAAADAELAAAMVRLVGDAGLRRELRARGLARVHQFTRQRTARELLRVLRG
ncbi:MAG: glycosyltransferase family 4 protein [Nevskia sp.]|nr:glycosyltransferase family 4 protein [Nevskia sp.]